MADKEFKIKGGVLIVGSLLWQDYLDDPDDNIRENWRTKHLLIDEKIMVRVPIRYGRYSNKSDIYTMTFSKTVSSKKFGTAYFIPFSKKFITTNSELLGEAMALSNAEGMEEKFVTNWSALGILFNDKKINKGLKKEVITFWKSKIIEKGNFNHLNYKVSKRETTCIKKSGLLNFNWIKPVDNRQEESLNSYDFAIATATLPTEYPTLEKLSRNVRTDKSRFYFIENYRNGITTFQDINIINTL